MTATTSRPKASRPQPDKPVASVPKPGGQERPAPRKKDWPEPILTIQAMTPERPWVLIQTDEEPEGFPVEIKLIREFPMVTQSRLTNDGEEFDELYAKRDKTNPENKRFKLILDRMFDDVVVMNDDLARALSKADNEDHIKGQVVTAFTTAPFEKRARELRAQEARLKAEGKTDEEIQEILTLDT